MRTVAVVPAVTLILMKIDFMTQIIVINVHVTLMTQNIHWKKCVV